MTPLMFTHVYKMMTSSIHTTIPLTTIEPFFSKNDFDRQFYIYLAALVMFKHSEFKKSYVDARTAKVYLRELTACRIILTSQLIRTLDIMRRFTGKECALRINQQFGNIRKTFQQLEVLFTTLYGSDEFLYCTIEGWKEFHKRRAKFQRHGAENRLPFNHNILSTYTLSLVCIFDRESVFGTLGPESAYIKSFVEKYTAEISIIKGFFDDNAGHVGHYHTLIEVKLHQDE